MNETPRSGNRKRTSQNVASIGQSAGPTLTNLSKVFWPEEGWTKGDLIAYYREMAPVMLPHLRDRPQSLHRHPNGIHGKSFFQKDVSTISLPRWAETLTIHSENEDRDITYLLCQDAKTLLYIANLGCIEINPWFSRIGSLDSPDYLAIDLDPEDIGFEEVVNAALAVRRALEDAGAPSLCKTSGKSGLHVCVPLGARYDYDQAKTFAELIANLVQRQLPETTSVLRIPSRRRQRVYLDFLQNRRAQTLAAPYSVRPVPGACVATPLRWSEVRRGLDRKRYTMKTIPARVEKLGDLWKPMLGKGIDLADCLARLQKGKRSE